VLEARLRQFELQGIEYSAEIQLAARRVANKNRQLRTLLNQVGVDDNTVRNFLQSMECSEAIIESSGSLTSNFPDTFIGKASPYSNHEDITSFEDGCGSPMW
jgi:hypothetical protein